MKSTIKKIIFWVSCELWTAQSASEISQNSEVHHFCKQSSLLLLFDLALSWLSVCNEECFHLLGCSHHWILRAHNCIHFNISAQIRPQLVFDWPPICHQFIKDIEPPIKEQQNHRWSSLSSTLVSLWHKITNHAIWWWVQEVCPSISWQQFFKKLKKSYFWIFKTVLLSFWIVLKIYSTENESHNIVKNQFWDIDHWLLSQIGSKCDSKTD